MFLAIKTPRLVLRPIGMPFLESTHRYASDRAQTKYMMYLPNDTIEDTAAFLDSADAQWAKPRPDCYEFAVLSGGVHIGAVSLYPDGKGGAELGCRIAPEYAGHGYGTEAFAAAAEWAIYELMLTRLVAKCCKENAASYKMLSSCMRKTGEDDTFFYFEKLV